MKKLIYFALVLPMAMLVIACGEKTKSNPEGLVNTDGRDERYGSLP